MTVEQAARDFFGWFNRHYPAPSTNPDHEWNRLGVVLANHQEEAQAAPEPAPHWNRRLAVDDLIERLRALARCEHSDTSIAEEAAAALEAAREDAERWRHARRILTVEDIESAQDMFDAFGVEGDEHENQKADAAIDQARGKESGNG